MGGRREICFISTCGATRRRPLRGNPARPSRRETTAETLHLLPRGRRRVLRAGIFSRTARSGLCEAVDASRGVPENRCHPTSREPVANHHETHETYVLAQGPREELVECERERLRKAPPGRSDREVRLNQTPIEEGDERSTTRRNPREHRTSRRGNTCGWPRTHQRRKTLKPDHPWMINGRRVGILRGMAAGEGKASKGDASWKERCFGSRKVEGVRAATR
jgi:hypothetical protein